MTLSLITKKRASINEFLRPVAITMPTTEITIGDLHGNALKLLCLLSNHGIIKIQPADYARIVSIYSNAESLSKETLEEFDSIIEKIKVLRHDILLRLIGDELSDRGQNDYFTLKIFQKLKLENMPLEVMLSNHGAVFIHAYEHVEKNKGLLPTALKDKYTQSLVALNQLIQNKLVSIDQVMELINSSYKPTLKVMGYSLDDKLPGITLFTHAGVGLETVRGLCKKFGIVYQDETSIELAQTIDAINQEFSKYVNENSISSLFDLRVTENFKADQAVECIIWNRSYEELERPAEHKGYHLNFVHGHDPKDESHGHIYNLDNDFGKPHKPSKEYTILTSDEHQLQLKLDATHCDEAEEAPSKGFTP